MEICGIQFAPLNVSLERRLQTLSVAGWLLIFPFGNALGPILAFYLVVYTKYWWLTSLYLFWIWVLDKDISNTGGRPSKWVRSWSIWKYCRDYFPLGLEKLSQVELDPKKNYLFCCFPHGILSIGVFNAFATEWSGFEKLFPNHVPHIAALTQFYFIPFLRDIGLGMRGIACSAKSIGYVLGFPGGGNVCVLVPGGAAEAYFARPGSYTLLLNKRKGFVKLALEYGTPLVPVVSFGETDLFDQLDIPKLREAQESVRKWIGLAPIFFLGRGFFQYTFGLLPRRRKVTLVVGDPIDVPKIENPTKEDVEKFHLEFSKRIVQLFEEQKYNYLDKPEKKQMIIS